MGNDTGFYAPLAYSAWLPWAGLGVLVLVAAWLAYVILSTRRRPDMSAAAPPAPPSDPSSLKRDYLRRIDVVTADAAAGRLSARASQQELSLLIRSFVRDIAGIDAPRMTLAELNEQNIPAAALAVSSLYPAEFSPGPCDTDVGDTELGDSVAVAAETAREVVRTWN
ncbi:hypothetical protein D9M72_532480 [compost metagenome]